MRVTSFPSRHNQRACAICVPRAYGLPTSAGWSAFSKRLMKRISGNADSRRKASVTPSASPCHGNRARGPNIMAAKSRSVRSKRAPRKRPAKKRSAAGKTRKSHASSGAVGAALAAFAHEVRTPLKGILASADRLGHSGPPARERRWVDTIKAGAEHLASLATLFVDAAKQRNAAGIVREDLFDLRTLARSVGDSLAGRAAAKGLQSRIEISEALPSLV